MLTLIFALLVALPGVATAQDSLNPPVERYRIEPAPLAPEPVKQPLLKTFLMLPAFLLVIIAATASLAKAFTPRKPKYRRIGAQLRRQRALEEDDEPTNAPGKTDKLPI